MNSLQAFINGEMNRGKPMMVFDWDKAAALIRERKPQVASAGLHSDWEWTGGDIYRDGKPIPKDETYTYLASTWATPELDMDGEVQPCFIMQDVSEQRWGNDDPAHIYWPDSAIQILNG